VLLSGSAQLTGVINALDDALHALDCAVEEHVSLMLTEGAVRSNHEAEHGYPEPSPDGEVGWMPTIDISEGHESGNIGKEPIDPILVTLKK
jgi:hypothetical protein